MPFIDCEDQYEFLGVMCADPVPLKLSTEEFVVHQVDRLICRELCSDIYSSRCTGFFYLPATAVCVIGRHSLSSVNLTDSCKDKGLQYEYQKRHRCLGKVIYILHLPIVLQHSYNTLFCPLLTQE